MSRAAAAAGGRRRFAARAADGVVFATLVALPLVGCGVVRALTGRDIGTGVQVAYLGLALGLALAWRADGLRAVWTASPRWWRRWWVLAAAALSLSALGLVTDPAPAPPALRWARFGRQLLQWILLAGFPFLAAWWLAGRPQRWRRLEKALLAGLLLQAAYGLGQWLAFGHAVPWWERVEAVMTSNPGILCGSGELYLGRHFQGIPRLRGTACEPLYLGNYLLLLLPWLVLAARRRRRLLWAPALALLLLLGTWSRGAWLALLPEAAAAWWLARRAGWRPGRTAWRAAAGGAGVVLAAGAALVAAGHGDALLLPWRRLLQSFSGEDWSNLTRWYSQQAAWRCFRLAPLWGVGWGQFGFHFPWLVDLRGLQSQFTWPVVNNYFLRVLAETGVIGCGVLLLAVRETVRRVDRAVTAAARTGGEAAAARLVAAAAAVAGCWAQLLTFSMVNLPHLWVALGLLAAAWRESARAAPAGREAAP